MRQNKVVLIVEFVVGVIPITLFALFMLGTFYPFVFLGGLHEMSSGYFNRIDITGSLIFFPLSFLGLVCQWRNFSFLIANSILKERKSPSIFRFYGTLIGALSIGYLGWTSGVVHSTAEKAVILPYLVVTMHWLYLLSAAALPLTSIKKKRAACIVVIFLLLLGWLIRPIYVENTELLKMTETEREREFSKFLKDRGTRCDSVVRTYYFGRHEKTGEEIWNLACKNNETYVILISARNIGSVGITGCEVFERVLNLGKCFNKRLPQN